VKFNKFAGQIYVTPLIRQLTLQRVRCYVRDLAREFLQIIVGWRKKPGVQAPPVCEYQAPKMTKLTPEQAKLRLLGQLSVGHEGARELLDVLFAEPDDADTALQSTEGKLARRGTG